MTAALATREPAAAFAMARCLAARSVAREPDRAITASHARPCGWCPYPLDEVRKAVDEFNAWAGYSERDGVSDRHLVRTFVELPRAEREAAIVEAQAFEPIPPAPAQPPVAVETDSTTPAPEEENAWA